MNPQRQEGNREKASRKPKWKNYDFTMFLSRITTSRCIAVKWYLRVYWLLPFSIVASFKKNRRFFCLESTLLLESTDDSFAEHRWILGPVNQLHFPKESFPYFNGLFFSSSTEIVDNLLKQQTPATRPSWFLFDKTVMPKIRNPSVFRAVPGYVLALLKDGHQRDEISPLNGNLKERKR